MTAGHNAERTPRGLTSNVPFVSGHGLSLLVVALFVAYIVVAALTIISNLMQIGLLSEAAGGGVSPEQVTSNDLRQGVLGILKLIVFAALVVAFLLWLHRVMKNLTALGNAKTRVEYTPGWAVGSFFIPFGNLFMPYRAVKEAWNKSNPLVSTEDEVMFPPPSPTGLLAAWWGSWIAMNFISRAASRIQSDASSAETLVWATWLEIVADVVSILSAALAIFVVRGLDKRQEERSRQVTYVAHTPPPPPLFTPPPPTQQPQS